MEPSANAVQLDPLNKEHLTGSALATLANHIISVPNSVDYQSFCLHDIANIIRTNKAYFRDLRNDFRFALFGSIATHTLVFCFLAVS